MKPCKVVLTVEVEITDTKKVMAEGRRVAQRPRPTNRQAALMEIIHDRIDRTQGIELSGLSATRVDWFQYDSILDPRHPDYSPRPKRGCR
jgi:hypothetical protein